MLLQMSAPLVPLINLPIMITLSTHCQWEDDMARPLAHIHVYRRSEKLHYFPIHFSRAYTLVVIGLSQPRGSHAWIRIKKFNQIHVLNYSSFSKSSILQPTKKSTYFI